MVPLHCRIGRDDIAASGAIHMGKHYDRLQGHSRACRQAQGRGGRARLPAAQGAVPEGAGEGYRRPGAGRDGPAHLLGRLRVERHREEMAGLRGGLPRLRSEEAHLPAGRVLGGPAQRQAHRAQSAEDQGRARERRLRARHRQAARQLRQVSQRSGRPTIRSACSSCWPNAARASAATRASTSCASSARTSTSPRPT